METFTDRDVLDHPQLRPIAEEYVRTYTGTFQPIKDCRVRLAQGYTLETPHIRMVLNTMRTDPRIQLPEVERAVVHYDAFKYVPEEVCRAQTAMRRPAYIDLPFKMHHQYGMSTHIRAEVIHRLGLDRSRLTYYPHMTQKRWEDRFHFHLHWRCSASVPKESSLRLLTTEEARELVIDEGLRRWCPTCLALD